jgi:muramoyltetrapeptide carboxypeptidase
MSLTTLREPPPLGVGARIAMVCPSGPLNGPHELERAVTNAESLGWRVQVGAHVLARSGYVAGDDAQRGDDLVRAMLDDDIDGIWCIRGGYGAMRLLPRVRQALERMRPKALIGYSDITALHAAWHRAGLVSFHGPTARSPLSQFSRSALEQVVQQGGSPTWQAADALVLRAGATTGRLAGGNLALLAALCGTPWAVSFRDAIVVLEDINEAVYRVDRLLVQLRLAGAFDGCVALAVGHFTDCPDTSGDGTQTIAGLVATLAGDLQVPALFGIPVGHIEQQWTIPLGAGATLDADARTLQVHRQGMTELSPLARTPESMQ